MESFVVRPVDTCGFVAVRESMLTTRRVMPYTSRGNPQVKGVPPAGLARYWLFQVSGQILQDVLFALLDFKQDGFRHPSVVLSGMHLTGLQQDFPQIRDAFLREQHLVVGLNHGNSNSTIPRFPKLLEV